eukprot:6404743-Pyramimonas_sp.AAC.1
MPFSMSLGGSRRHFVEPVAKPKIQRRHSRYHPENLKAPAGGRAVLPTAPANSGETLGETVLMCGAS